jgi:hypothetical protein
MTALGSAAASGSDRGDGESAVPAQPGVAGDDVLLAAWRLGSLRGRLLWSMVLVLVLALGGLGLRTASDASQRLQSEESARARALARSVALTIVNPLLTQQ